MSKKGNSFRPLLENLEDRTVPYALSGSKWANTNISASFLPDGTPTEGYSSSLYATLASTGTTEQWQREFARALQTWANVSTLNFHFVPDSGAPSGTSGSAQGDSRFGDIRLGAHPLSGYVAYAYYPSGTTLGGDITLSPSYTYNIGTYIDLYSVLLHEVGHSLGLDHSTSGTVMYSTITGVYSGLTSDDIAGIRAIYGARQADSFDRAGSNDSLASASALSLNSSGAVSISGDLTSMADVDYYRLTAPAGSDGTLTVTLDARGLSFLAGKVSLFDSAGNLLGSASAAYGQHAVLNFSGVTAGQSYFLQVDGATADEFGMGAYKLQVQFGLTSAPPPPSTGPAPDRFEANDSLQSATNLGRISSTSQTGLTIHSASDVDFFRFEARFSASYQLSILAASGSGNLDLALYDSAGNLIARSSSLSGSESLTVSLTAGQVYYVQVFSPDGSVGTYDLSIAKTGGSTSGGGGKGGKGGKGGLVEGDGTYAAGYEPADLTRFAFLGGHAADVLHDLPGEVLEKLAIGKKR